MKKKSLIGWVREDWKERFISFYPAICPLILPEIRTKRYKGYGKKVRITIEEIK